MAYRAGIRGYGVFVPQHRLKIEDIWTSWCHRLRPSSLEQRWGVKEKAVNSWHEDVITMASDAAKAALEMAGSSAGEVKGLFLGSCTNPYVTRPSTTLVAESLGMPSELMAADCQFSGKSGTAALQICLGLVSAGLVSQALAVGSDSLSAHVAPNDWPQEYFASAAAAAFLLGEERIIARIEATYSYATETADFFRLDGDRYIKRGVSIPEEGIGYRDHVVSAVRGFQARWGHKPGDFNYLALHQPNARWPLEVAQVLGFNKEQVLPGLVADRIGDCGSASSLLSLAAILDQAEAGERILLVSYGYGAGCDLFSLVTTDRLAEARSRRRIFAPLSSQLDRKVYLDYTTYIRMERKLIQEYV